ncbi:glycosyltransferase [Congregibacter litoralis]|uniref:Glycosyltransferase n=1 Tax=Congregibacter litoralis KT71 TaxID=314285 RepID=A4ABQ1_9GAMM|nr:glycosyltransferase [Congregibacter litoralis]EAQ96564.1 Glycosyltransferase [Congregibacter litoralis KT71]
MSALQQPLDNAVAPPDMPLRVAFFSDAFPERNGTGAYYHDLLPQLAPRVEGLEVFQPGAGVAAPRVSIPMPGDPGQRLVAPPLRHIRRRCDALRPHVVVAVTPGLYGLLGAWEARRHGAVLISAFHTDFDQLAGMYWRNPVFRSVVKLVVGTANRILCRRSRSVLINNANLEPQVRRLGAQHVEVIGTPLSREFLESTPPRIPEKLRRVCFAGRLAPEKNVEQIIRAAKSLPQLEFVICGEGPLRSALEAQASGIANIRFTGWLDRATLVHTLDNSSLLLLPSTFETFGSIALEAMARGRPALVSVTAGIHSWPTLRPGLFSMLRPEAVTGQLKTLLELTPEKWQEKSSDARNVALTLNRQTVEHWLGLLRKQRGSRKQARP